MKQKTTFIFTPLFISGCLILLVSFAIRATFGLFQIPISEHFGWLRTEYSLAIAIGLAPFFVKHIIDKFFEPNLENGSPQLKRLLTGTYVGLGVLMIFAFCQIAYVRNIFFRFMKTDISTEANVYNIQGQIVKKLLSDYMEEGDYDVRWNASNVSSGIYYITFELNNVTITNKVVYIK